MTDLMRIFIFIFLLLFAVAGFSEDTDTTTGLNQEVPLMEEQVQQEELVIEYGKDSIRGKALDSTTWKALTKELYYNDTLDTVKKSDRKTFNFNPSFSINPTLTKYLLFGIVTIALLYLLYRLIGSAVLGRDTKITKIKATFEILHDDEQMMQQDLNTLLHEALQKEDYKSAIRILFIQSLQTLEASQLIQWKKEKTNRDYVNELINTTSFVPFNSMVLLYQKAWYSSFPSTKEDLDAFYSFKTELFRQ